MFHILFTNYWGSSNIFNLTQEELDKVLKCYNYGKESFYIKGELYSFENLFKINIYKAIKSTSEIGMPPEKLFETGHISRNPFKGDGYYNSKGMLLIGEDVTEEFIKGDFGEERETPIQNGLVSSSEPEPEIEFDYAIITALYRDELKFVEPYIKYGGEIVEDDKKLIRYGTLKSNQNKRIVYASLLNTGMVDAAIFTTDIITKYKPKVLIMPGVCGGRDDSGLNLEDIIVANKVFTFQKGKQEEDEFKPEWEGVDLNEKLIQQIQVGEDHIIQTLRYRGKIHYEPMACSTAVIDKEGILEKIIAEKDRKTMGLEMEGYGVARACQIANNGNTKCLIIKSVMDKTKSKDDSVKKEAAQNSANFTMKLIELEII